MLDDKLVIAFTRDRPDHGAIAVESEKWDVQDLMLSAYFPVLWRVDVKATERDDRGVWAKTRVDTRSR